MTHRGSLTYYLSAWICGGLFVTLAGYWNGSAGPVTLSRGLPGAVFLTRYFLVLIFGAFLLLLFGFLLRRVVGWFHLGKLWQWALTGAILVVPVQFAIRWLLHTAHMGSLSRFFMLPFFTAAGELAQYQAWLALPVAAATSGVLFLVHRAFAHP